MKGAVESFDERIFVESAPPLLPSTGNSSVYRYSCSVTAVQSTMGVKESRMLEETGAFVLPSTYSVQPSQKLQRHDETNCAVKRLEQTEQQQKKYFAAETHQVASVGYHSDEEDASVLVYGDNYEFTPTSNKEQGKSLDQVTDLPSFQGVGSSLETERDQRLNAQTKATLFSRLSTSSKQDNELVAADLMDAGDFESAYKLFSSIIDTSTSCCSVFAASFSPKCSSYFDASPLPTSPSVKANQLKLTRAPASLSLIQNGALASASAPPVGPASMRVGPFHHHHHDPLLHTRYFLRAQCAFAMRRYHDAIDDCTRASRLLPVSADNIQSLFLYACYLQCRGSCYFCLSNYEFAIRDYTRSLDTLTPEMMFYPHQIADLYESRGNAYYFHGEMAMAIEDYTEAIAWLCPQRNKYPLPEEITDVMHTFHQQQLKHQEHFRQANSNPTPVDSPSAGHPVESRPIDDSRSISTIQRHSSFDTHSNMLPDPAALALAFLDQEEPLEDESGYMISTTDVLDTPKKRKSGVRQQHEPLLNVPSLQNTDVVNQLKTPSHICPEGYMMKVLIAFVSMCKLARTVSIRWKQSNSPEPSMNISITDTTHMPSDSESWATCYFSRADALRKLKHYDAAIFDYTIFLHHEHFNPQAYYCRGVCYQELRQYERAIREFSFAIRLAPNMIDAFNNRGVSYHSWASETDRSVEESRAHRRRPGAAGGQSATQTRVSRMFSTRQLLRHSSSSVTSSSSLSHSGHRHRSPGFQGPPELFAKFQCAIDDYTVAIGLSSSTDPKLFYNRGVAFHAVCALEKAIADYNVGIRLIQQVQSSGGNADTYDLYKLYFNRAVSFHDMGFYLDAVQDISRGLSFICLNCHVFHDPGAAALAISISADHAATFRLSLPSQLSTVNDLWQDGVINIANNLNVAELLYFRGKSLKAAATRLMHDAWNAEKASVSLYANSHSAAKQAPTAETDGDDMTNAQARRRLWTAAHQLFVMTADVFVLLQSFLDRINATIGISSTTTLVTPAHSFSNSSPTSAAREIVSQECIDEATLFLARFKNLAPNLRDAQLRMEKLEGYADATLAEQELVDLLVRYFPSYHVSQEKFLPKSPSPTLQPKFSFEEASNRQGTDMNGDTFEDSGELTEHNIAVRRLLQESFSDDEQTDSRRPPRPLSTKLPGAILSHRSPFIQPTSSQPQTSLEQASVNADSNNLNDRDQQPQDANDIVWEQESDVSCQNGSAFSFPSSSLSVIPASSPHSLSSPPPFEHGSMTLSDPMRVINDSQSQVVDDERVVQDEAENDGSDIFVSDAESEISLDGHDHDPVIENQLSSRKINDNTGVRHEDSLQLTGPRMKTNSSMIMTPSQVTPSYLLSRVTFADEGGVSNLSQKHARNNLPASENVSSNTEYGPTQKRYPPQTDKPLPLLPKYRPPPPPASIRAISSSSSSLASSAVSASTVSASNLSANNNNRSPVATPYNNTHTKQTFQSGSDMSISNDVDASIDTSLKGKQVFIDKEQTSRHKEHKKHKSRRTRRVEEAFDIPIPRIPRHLEDLYPMSPSPAPGSTSLSAGTCAPDHPESRYSRHGHRYRRHHEAER